MALSGNRGEWSEIYAFLRLLADGKLYAADDRLNRIQDMFFPIIKIIREEDEGYPYEYKPHPTSAVVEIFLNGEKLLHIPAKEFEKQATHLLDKVSNAAKGKGAFDVPKTESFIRSIYVNKLKAPSTDKTDICVKLHDFKTGYKNIVGFSIKSELGMPPTLLNAANSTNFAFKAIGLKQGDISRINAINTRRKIKDRIAAIKEAGGSLVFSHMASDTFLDNLVMIDSKMPEIVAHMIFGYYSDVAFLTTDLTDYVSVSNPLSQSKEFYRYKIKELLCAIALGMRPAKEWDGTDEATGGYIIVKTNGDVLAYHVYNRDAFRDYLINNTKFESPASNRHNYGALICKDGETWINLNLQIRFI
jgi:hypothetical protein